MHEPAAVARLLRQRATHGFWLDVTGRSMAPDITPPARVWITEAARPRIGEVWAFVASTGDVVVHRSVGLRRSAGFVFVGDANPGRDGLVPAERLVGRVRRVERDGSVTPAHRRSGLGPLATWAVRALRRRLTGDHAA